MDKFHIRTIRYQYFKDWLKVEWDPLIGYLPIFLSII
jgi:hypothetical protein